MSILQEAENGIEQRFPNSLEVADLQDNQLAEMLSEKLRIQIYKAPIPVESIDAHIAVFKESFGEGENDYWEATDLHSFIRNNTGTYSSWATIHRFPRDGVLTIQSRESYFTHTERRIEFDDGFEASPVTQVRWNDSEVIFTSQTSDGVLKRSIVLKRDSAPEWHKY